MQPPATTGQLAHADTQTTSNSLTDPLASSATQQDDASATRPATPNEGDKPARPPKAAHRMSMVGAPHQQLLPDDMPTMTNTEAGSAAPVSSVERVDDAAAVRDLASSDAAAAPVTTASSAPTMVNNVPKQPSTADRSVSAQTGESAAAASNAHPSNDATSSTLPSTSTPSTKPVTASSTPVSAPRSTPAASARTPAPAAAAKKKRKGGLASLFACLPCFGSTGHDDTPANAGKSLRTSAAPRVAEQEKRNAANTTAPNGKDTATSSREKDVSAPAVPVVAATAANPATTETSEKPMTTSLPAPSKAAVEPEAALTPPPTDPLVAASTEGAAAAQLAPPPTSAPTPRGVMLSEEETEGVTSGAVVPPGQAPTGPLAAAAAAAAAASTGAATAVAAVGATKSKRKRSGKNPHGRAGGGATDGIITSVPEPGAPVGGRAALLARPAGEETSSEDASSEEDEEDEEEDEEDEEEEEDEEAGLIARGGVGIPIGEDGLPHPLLDELSEDLRGRKCLVLDLDETLVHSSFKMVHQADYVVPVEIENQFHNVYVIKRPGVDAFLKAMGDVYEVVVFTASLSKYADPVLDQLDVHRVVKHRLFRESCYNNKGNYVKDLSQLGRPISECIIIDNSPASYVFHPNNAVPISSWFNDPHDTELTDLIPFLTDLGAVDDVRSVLDANLYPVAAAGDAAVTDGVFQQL